MIAVFRAGLTRFVHDPLGAMEAMRDRVPSAPVAAMALMAAALVHVIIDYSYGSYAWPHSMEPGGKRAAGPVIMAAVDVARIHAVAAIVMIGGRVLFKTRISGALAMWMTVPFALAQIGMDLVEVSAVVFFLATDVSIYGQMFMVAFIGQVLVMIVAIRATFPDRDWLSCLPLGMTAIIAGYYLAPVILLIAGIHLLVRRPT